MQPKELRNPRPCSHCSGTTIEMYGDMDGFYDRCDKCGVTVCRGGSSRTISKWNVRPIEDALLARIAELEAENLKIKTDNAFNKDAFRCFIDRIHKFEEDAKYMSLDIEHRDTRIAELEVAHKWNRYDPEDESTYPPGPYQLCLVFTITGMPMIAVYGANNKWYTGQDFVEVSHWMTLPEYPDQESKGNAKRDN